MNTYTPRTTVAVPLLTLTLFCANLSAQDPAARQLNSSPRHHEWVQIASSGRTVHAFVAYPEKAEPVPAVLVIHENRGLTDWVKSVADRLAEEGYLAIAPDMLSGRGPDGGHTADFKDRDSARDALYAVPPEMIAADLQAVADSAIRMPASDGTLTVAGFCWGGRQTFQFATDRSDLNAAFVFYGTPPREPASLSRISCPVYGFYGENDARVTRTVETAREQMKSAGKIYEPVVYSGAGHGFMRSGEQQPPEHPNAKARAAAWVRWLELLSKS